MIQISELEFKENDSDSLLDLIESRAADLGWKQDKITPMDLGIFTAAVIQAASSSMTRNNALFERLKRGETL